MEASGSQLRISHSKTSAPSCTVFIVEKKIDVVAGWWKEEDNGHGDIIVYNITVRYKEGTKNYDNMMYTKT